MSKFNFIKPEDLKSVFGDPEVMCGDCGVVFSVDGDTDLDYPRCHECGNKAMRQLIDEQKHPDCPAGLA